MKNKKSVRLYRRQLTKIVKSRKVTKTKTKKEKVVKVEKKPLTAQEREVIRLQHLKKRRERDRLRRRLRNADRVSSALTPSERADQEIENSSRVGHPCHARRAFIEDHNKGAIDHERLDHGVDPDQLEHEHMLESPYQGKVFEKSNPDLTATPFEPPTCDCNEGDECEVCLARHDLAAVPPQHIKDITVLPRVSGIEQFKVRMPVAIAESLDQAVG